MTRGRSDEVVLVAGGAGFLGSHLCRVLLDHGSTVICVDDFSTGSRERINELEENPRFSVIQHDITSALSVDIDRIYNLACPASPTQYRRIPISTARTNTIGVANLLELAREKNASFLQASTSEVYGDPLVHPQTEDYFGNVNSVGSRANYSEGKRAAEMLVSTYHRAYGFPVRIARIFNTYGPGMARDDGRAVSTFVSQAQNESTITVHGNGEQTRSFCYVDDMVDGLVRTMIHTDLYVGPINLGNPEEVRIVDLAHFIRDTVGSRAQIEFRARDEGDPNRRCPDISLARRKLDWKPKVSLAEGLQRTIEYMARETTAEGPCS